MKLDRRRALALLGGAIPAASAAGAARAQTPAVAPAFAHGVASGDPLTDRVILWTRVSGAAGPVEVYWRIAEDKDFRRGVQRGTLVAGPERDHTLKVDVSGLKPGRDYWFYFGLPGLVSTVGRTRTLPTADSEAPVTFAVASCALYSAGLFNVYRAIADQPRLDAVLHLGDYIYEYGGAPTDYGIAQGEGLNRPPRPLHECVSLADYRARHAQYKTDPDLQAAHARAPFIATFDDHEIANDPWMGGAQSHNPENGEGDWPTRKAAALTAYLEWMPIRQAPNGPLEAIERSFRFGKVASLHMIETRLLARSEPLDYGKDLVGADGDVDFPGFLAKLNNPDRRVMGEAQMAWLGGELRASVDAGVTWQVIGNQVVMARVVGPDIVKALGQEAVDAAYARVEGRPRMRLQQMAALASYGVPSNLDAWDGYPAERERLYGLFRETGAHAVVLSGDSHAAWVNELHDSQARRVAVEFSSTAISSPTPSSDSIPGIDVKPIIIEQNADVVHMETAKGFTLLTLTRESAQAELVRVSTIRDKAFEVESGKRFRVRPEAGGVSAIEAL